MPVRERRKRNRSTIGAPEWMTTYGDMVTLLLTFFVMLYTTATIDGYKLKLILSAFSGLGMTGGGNTLQVGELAELGNNVESLPSLQKGRALDEARRRAVSLFQPDVESNLVRITEDERGLIVSLAADAFFESASSEVAFEESREVLERASVLMRSLGEEQKFRIEGHTDSIPVEEGGEWPSNWELSAERAANVLHYLVDFGVREDQLQIAGFSSTSPLVKNDTPEGRAYNRRVDIVIITDGNL